MRELHIGAQLYIGGAERESFSPKAVEEAIRKAKETAGIESLLIWVNHDNGTYAEPVAACRKLGVAPYLWFPVLADAPGPAFDPGHLVETADRQRGHGRSGAWEGLAGGEESFLFLCPNDAAAVDEVFARYAALLDRAGVDGVMLDRIRFPSPANGFEALLTCFCPACAARFEREAGYPLDTLRARARALLEEMRGWTPQEAERRWAPGALRAPPDGLFEAAGLADLAAFRARSITAMVARFAGHARERRLKVGLDLFSPALAGLVGQDYRALAACADWIKPMTYCHAVGPAGLPLELASLARALVALCPRLEEVDALALLRRAFGWPLPGPSARLLAEGLPEHVLALELEAIGRLGLPPGVAVHAGIEAVRIPHFGIDITPRMIGRYLDEAAGRAEGLIASWNLLAIPAANLRRLGAARG